MNKGELRERIENRLKDLKRIPEKSPPFWKKREIMDLKSECFNFIKDLLEKIREDLSELSESDILELVKEKDKELQKIYHKFRKIIERRSVEKYDRRIKSLLGPKGIREKEREKEKAAKDIKFLNYFQGKVIVEDTISLAYNSFKDFMNYLLTGKASYLSLIPGKGSGLVSNKEIRKKILEKMQKWPKGPKGKPLKEGLMMKQRKKLYGEISERSIEQEDNLGF